MITAQLETLKEQLKNIINDDRIEFKPLSTDKGSYAIKYPPNNRIARFVYVENNTRQAYKFVCDKDVCKRLFDKISIKYKERPGYQPPYENSHEAKIFYLQDAVDAKEFLLEVTREYIKTRENK